MISDQLKYLSISLAAALVSAQALADADIAIGSANTSLTARANLDLRITVPKILILRVGQLGNGIDELAWSLSSAYGTGNEQTFNDTTPFAISDLSDSGDQSVDVYVFSNAGDVSLDSSAGDWQKDGATADDINDDDFAVTNTENVPFPATGGLDGSTTIGGGPVISESDTWTFSYQPSTLPAAGEYTTRIAFTATNP